VRPLIVSLVVVAGTWCILVIALLLAGRRSQAREFITFLPNLVLLFKDLVRDRRVPRSSKMLLVVGALWFASPIDLIPEFIPVVGPFDDAIVAALIIRRVLKVAGEKVVRDHWRGSSEALRLLLRLSGVRSVGEGNV
jgi:uncharacterized membrane protein YkvA (DUF1232 family)